MLEGSTPSQTFISGGHFTSAGRDVNNHLHNHTHTHTHHHHAPGSGSSGIDVLAELKSIDNHRKIHQDTLRRRTPKTGEWIIKDEQFVHWRNPSGELQAIWGSGIPGAGKTVFTSIVIDAVARYFNPAEVYVGFFYIRYSDNSNLTIQNVLEVFVKQAIEKHPACLQMARILYEEHIHLDTQPTEDELLDLLQQFSQAFTTMFCFLDALDEAPSGVQFDLVEKLLSLPIKLFITSRPLSLLQAEFPSIHCFPIAASDHDLDLHINKEIQRTAQLRHILDDGDGSRRAEVVSLVKGKCGGMFLHASLQMVALRECASFHDVKESLAQFPARIEDVYIQTWERILRQPKNQCSIARVCLSWVLYAERSMTVDELRHAIAASPTTYELDRDRLVPIDTLLAFCFGLFVVDEKTRLVRLVHYTAKDTLERLIKEDCPHMHYHYLLASVCMVLLTTHGFQSWEDSKPNSLAQGLTANLLLPYAYHAWAFHARASLDDAATTTRVADFIKGCHSFPIDTGAWRLNLLGPLHVVARFHLPPSLAGFDPSMDPNPRTNEGDTPLLVACRSNSQSTMEELLDLPNINVNATNKNGKTALMYALQDGNIFMAERLLAHSDIEINPTPHHQKSALIQAASHGRIGLAKLLLTHPRLDLNAVDGEGLTPLIWALKRRSTIMMELLLSLPNLDVNMPDAMRSPHPDIAKYTHHRSSNEQGQTPLAWAVKGGHVETAGLLLRHPDIDVNCRDREGQTPLHYVSNLDIAHLLLHHPQTNINAPDALGQTPLIQASKQCHLEVAQLLLSRAGINVNAADWQGLTALAWAARMGHVEMAEQLLRHPQVDVNRADIVGYTPLFWAVQGKYSAPTGPSQDSNRTVELFLAHPQVDVNQADAQGQTPLKLAVKEGFGDVVELLVAHPRTLVKGGFHGFVLGHATAP